MAALIRALTAGPGTPFAFVPVGFLLNTRYGTSALRAKLRSRHGGDVARSLDLPSAGEIAPTQLG
jgi:hypothetical protein